MGGMVVRCLPPLVCMSNVLEQDTEPQISPDAVSPVCEWISMQVLQRIVIVEVD